MNKTTNNTINLLCGALAGAAAMYLLDPEAGRKRREAIAEAGEGAFKATGDAAGSAWDYVSHGTRAAAGGLADAARSAGSGIATGAAATGSALGAAGRRSADWTEAVAEGVMRALRSAGSKVGLRERTISDDLWTATGAHERTIAGDLGTATGRRERTIHDDLFGSTSGSAGRIASNWASSLGEGASSAGSAISDWASSLGAGASRLGGRTRDVVSRRRDEGDDDDSHTTAYALGAIATAGLGAAAMYLLDPKKGRQRRALAQDKITAIVGDTGTAFRQGGRFVRDVLNRSTGAAHELSSRYGSGQEADASSPEQLIQRVRSELGHATSHASSIQVMSSGDGTITLSGQILAADVDKVLAAVHTIKGVARVVNQLDVQDTIDA
jgi:gas vesicle protein